MKLFETRFGPLSVFGAVCLGLALVLRVALALAAIHDMDATLWTLVKMLAAGLLFDLVAYFYVALPAAVFLLAAPDRLARWRPVRWFGVGLYFVAIYVLLFSEAAEGFFWDEFGARFNFVAVDYLVYTQELTRNVWESYPVVPVLAAMFVAALAVVLATRKAFLAGFHAPSSFGRRLAPGAVFLAVPVLAAAFADQAWSRVSTNHYTNEIAKNGIFSSFNALANNIIEYDEFYLTEDGRDAFARLRELVKEPDATFVGDGPLDVTRQVAHSGPEKRWNVVSVADHCASSAGKSEVPVQQYHIPLLVYAPKLVKPACVDRLASQMDLAPTLLGLLNFTYRSKFFGNDVLESPHDRALVGNYEKVGLFAAGKLVVLLPRKKAQTFEADEDGHRTECREDKNLLRDAVSYYQSAAYLLRNHL